MNGICCFVFLLITGYVVADTTIHGPLFGPGVCTIHRMDYKQVPVMNMTIYNDTTYILCWAFPPWCKVPTDHELYSFSTALTNLPHERLLLKCCSGYRTDKNGRKCNPVCSVFCQKDSCIKPNNCSECLKGYSGPTCQKDGGSVTTPIPRCICPNKNFMCNNEFKCVCVSGFQGPQCEEEIIPEPIISDGGKKPCSYYIFQVSAIIAVLASVGIAIVVILRKRVSCSNRFQPLTDDIE